MDDETKKQQLQATLAAYTPEQRGAPDAKYGTVEKRIAAVFYEDPLEAQAEFQKEVEAQQAAVRKSATRGSAI